MRDRARLGAVSLPHAGDFLNVVPSPILGLHMRGSEFRQIVSYRLGIPVYDVAAACPACRRESSKSGDHAISCGTDGERISRHNQLRDALFATASTAALSPAREERALLPGDSRRPADVFLPHWSGGRDTALDVTVINPMRLDLIEREAEFPGFALGHAHDRKVSQVGEACEREGIVFIPVVFETFGGMSQAAVKVVRRLGAALAGRSGRDEGEVIGHLFQRLSVLLQKGNAALLSNREPRDIPVELDGAIS